MISNTVHPESLPGTTAFVLLGRSGMPTPEAWAPLLRDRLGGEISADMAGATSNLIIRIDGTPFIGFVVEHPVPSSEFEDSLRSTPDADELKAIIGRHMAHLTLANLSETTSMDAAIERAIRVLELASALPPDLEPLGVFWLPSRRLVPVDLAGAIAAGARQGASVQDGLAGRARHLPVSFWVRILLMGGDGLVAGRTQGLACFVGYELDLPLARRTPQAAHDLLASLVGYLFDRGSVFEPGQRLDVGNGEVATLAAFPAAEGAPPLMVLRDAGGLQ
jgi:hypothetical protein